MAELPTADAAEAARAIRVVVGRLRRRLREVAAGELTPSQASVLARLAKGEAASAAALAALVRIAGAFGAPTSETSWLVSGLYLATAIGQPLTGRLVDEYGPRRLFLAGATLTGIAGVIGVLAPSIGVLVVARVVLGFGTCA